MDQTFETSCDAETFLTGDISNIITVRQAVGLIIFCCLFTGPVSTANVKEHRFEIVLFINNDGIRIERRRMFAVLKYFRSI